MRTSVILMSFLMACGAVLAQAAQPAQPAPAGDFHQHVFSDEIIELIGPESGLKPLPAKAPGRGGGAA